MPIPRAALGQVAPAQQPDLGAMRTIMAADRTLMAWIRTSLSMFSFGYTIYKVLQELQDMGNVLPHESTPRNAGVFLTVTGTVALLLGILEYCATLRLLRRSYAFGLGRPSLALSALMAAGGLFLSFGIVTKLL